MRAHAMALLHGLSSDPYASSGAASTVVLAVSIAVLYSTLSTTDLREETETYLGLLSAGLLGTLAAWLALLRRYGRDGRLAADPP
jgi:ABC-type nickel/cobalt efflux system permease component RcnA